MNRPGFRTALFLILAVPIMATCGENGTAPAPSGDFQATVVSPSGRDGAALLELVGPVSDVRALGADTVLVRTRADTTWVFAGLRVPGTLSVRFQTPLGESAEGRVLEVVDGVNELQDLEGYRLEIGER